MKQPRRGISNLIPLACALVLVIALAFFLIPLIQKTHYSAAETNTETSVVHKVRHIETPEPLKAIYMTACVAGTPSWRTSLKKMIEDTELNSVLLDIKDYTGDVSFHEGANCFVGDLGEFIDELHQSDIYVIGRISVFQDPSYSKLHPELAVKSKKSGGVWHDRKGLSFIDVGARPYWDHIVELAKESYALGFDEINFDYVRYPSDGDMQDTFYSWTVGTSTKPEILESFFAYLDQSLDDVGVVTSADLFGMTTTVMSDMNIGQVLERALPHFDYIAPMVYPSHYPSRWNNFSNPAEHPYEVIKIAMSEGRRREIALNVSHGLATSTPSKLRPWLQDFDLGATYGAKEVRDQIQATYDSGLTSWMLWDASNKYTREALLPD